VDAVVIGGGVIGAACAYALAQRGVAVTLLERSGLAAGASGRNHGLVLNPLDARLLPMARATLELYREVAGRAPVPVRLDPDPLGLLLVAGEDPSERASGRDHAGVAASCGVPVETLDASRIREAEPALAHDLVEGWLLADGRRLDPAALTVSLALLAAAAGAEVRRYQAARAIVERGRVRGVVTDDGEVTGDTVVVAAGPWSGSLLRPIGVHLPTVGARGWLVHLDRAGVELARIVERAGWHPVPEEEPAPPPRAADLAAGGRGAEVGTLLHPTADGSILAGGSRQAASEPDDPSVPSAIARGAVALVPGLADAPVLGSWWGVRPMSPDGLPVVGTVGDGVVVATGHGSQGVILGGGTGELVAALALGEEVPFAPSPFDPGRFG
jgi:glycine/D-amino acid oxidase-like deaminating enzyme